MIKVIMQELTFAAKSYYPTLVDNIGRICKENHVDDTHGLAHALKIGQLTEQSISTEESLSSKDPDYDNIILAGYLHDIDDRKYFITQGCQNAVKVLKSIDISSENIAKIVSMIELVSFAKNGNTISEKVPIAYYLPRYIDRTEAIGIQGLYRSLIYNQDRTPKTTLFDEHTPRPSTAE
jgi:HD superfamily phosphodiesterase